MKCFGSHNHKAIAAYVATRSAAQVRYKPLELSDTKVYEPYIRARLGTAAHFCEVVVLTLRIQLAQRGTVRLSTLRPALPPTGIPYS